MKLFNSLLLAGAATFASSATLMADEAIVTANSYGRGSVSVSSKSVHNNSKGFPLSASTASDWKIPGTGVSVQIDGADIFDSRARHAIALPRTTLGVTVTTTTVKTGDRTEAGLVVTEVTPGSIAQSTGLRVNDVLLVIGDTTLRRAQDLVGFVHSPKFNNGVVVILTRGDRRGSLKLRGVASGQQHRMSSATFHSTDAKNTGSVTIRTDRDQTVVTQSYHHGDSLTADQVMQLLDNLSPEVRNDVIERLLEDIKPTDSPESVDAPAVAPSPEPTEAEQTQQEQIPASKTAQPIS